MKKRFLSLVLVMSILTSLTFGMPVKASSEQEKIISGIFTYITIQEDAWIVGCKTDATSVEIPEVIDGYAVRSIEYDAFKDCENLLSVTIHSGIEYIDPLAFFFL